MNHEDDTPLSGRLPTELAMLFGSGETYRGRQLFRWLQSGVFRFDAMSNLPGRIRELLEQRCVPAGSSLDDRCPDADGSVKFRIRLQDGHLIESVVLRDERGRSTACLSTQVGCGMGCSFCGTARMGLVRNLRAHEIVEQFLLLQSREGSISRIVFMGMGEPLQNLPALRRSIEILTHPEGQHVSLRRITVSTCGLVQGIRDLAKNGPHPRLAVSLVAADPELRRRLMPSAAGNSLPDIKNALLEYQDATGKRVTLEIVLLGGINDRREDARRLADFIAGLRCAANLLPWNPVPGIPYERPSTRGLEAYKAILRQRRVAFTQRYRRGGKVGAACGQLCVFQDGANPPNPGGG